MDARGLGFGFLSYNYATDHLGRVYYRQWRERVFRRGTARWEPGEPGSAKLGFRDTEMELCGTLGPSVSAERSSDALRRERQLRQLLGALLRRGTAPNDASTLLPALELADQCRRIRTMLALPWLSPNETALASSHGTHRTAA